MGNRRSYRSVRLHFWASGQRNCYYCSVPMTNVGGVSTSLTVDHKTPLGRGGRDDRANWVACCYRCNNAKSNLTEPEFRELMAAGKAFGTDRAKKIALATQMEDARRMRQLRGAQVHA